MQLPFPRRHPRGGGWQRPAERSFLFFKSQKEKQKKKSHTPQATKLGNPQQSGNRRRGAEVAPARESAEARAKARGPDTRSPRLSRHARRAVVPAGAERKRGRGARGARAGGVAAGSSRRRGRTGGLLSDGGGGQARAGRSAEGRGSERAGRGRRRSVANRARRGPARRRPRGGDAAEGRGRRGGAGGRPASGSVAPWRCVLHAAPDLKNRDYAVPHPTSPRQRRVWGLARGLRSGPAPGSWAGASARRLLAGSLGSCADPGPAAWSLRESRGPARPPHRACFADGKPAPYAAGGRLYSGGASC